MTEEEAKTKWCCGPLMNVMAAAIAAGKPLRPDEGNCVGSACMAWIDLKNTETAQTEADGPTMPEPPPGDGWEPGTFFVLGKYSYRNWSRPAPAGGRCGLIR